MSIPDRADGNSPSYLLRPVVINMGNPYIRFSRTLRHPVYCYMCRITALFLGLALLITGCARSADSLPGEWRGIGADGQRFILILKPNHTYHIISGGQAVDASMYRDFGMRWRSDEKQEPKRLILSATEGKDAMTIPVIYSLIERDRLVLRFGLTPQGERVEWEQLSWNLASPGSKQIILERAQETH